jgi:hypothetical protein
MTKTEVVRMFGKQFKRWKYMIEHYGWRLTVCYHDSAEDMPEDSGYETCAITVTNFRYLEATIHVNLKRCEDLGEHDIEYVVIHELTHLLVSPLQESSEATPLEYTVTCISRIFQGLRNGV